MPVQLRYAIGARQIASHGIDAEEVCTNISPDALDMTRFFLNVPRASLLDYALGSEWRQHRRLLISESR